MPSGPPVRGHATRRCPIRTAATFLFCALLCAEGLAAGKPAPNKASRPHAGDVRPAGRKKARRPASTKPTEPAETNQSGEATATQPSQAADDRQTVAIVLSRLGRTRRSQMSDRDVALKAALEFVRALGRADGQKAAGLLEVTGYQILPSGGEPPEEPGPRISPEAFATDVAARKPASFETLPADCFEAVRAKSLRPTFPVVAAWMLPADWAVILKPAPGRADWLQREACLVVRVRADKPTIQGGTALGALLGPLPREAGDSRP
jgi:hypothetical protein